MFNKNKIAEILATNSLDAVLLSSPINRKYISGFSSSAGMALITSDGKAYFLTDERYFAACKQTVTDNGFTAILPTARDYPSAVRLLCEKHGVKNLGYEDLFMSVNNHQIFCSALKGIELIGIGESVAKLRQIKTEQELFCIEKAQQITDRAFNELLNFIRVGVSESSLANHFDFLLKDYGATDIAFPTILVSGNRTLFAHGEPSEKLLAAGEWLLIDCGAEYNCYKTDMSRCVAIGYATEEMQYAYSAVLASQADCITAAKAGQPICSIVNAAADTFERMGYTRLNGVGHSIGLELHERPHLLASNSDLIYNGMVFAIEPGVTRPNWHIRIEDTICVTGNEAKNFANAPKQLIIVK